MEFYDAWVENHLNLSSSENIATCCKTPLVVSIAPKIFTGVNMLYPNLQSDLLSYHTRNTCIILVDKGFVSNVV